MLGLGTPELVVIMFIILLLFGGKKLPELAKALGTAVREFNSSIELPDRKDSMKETDEKKAAILDAARKMGIQTEGRSIKEISEDLVKLSGEATEAA